MRRRVRDELAAVPEALVRHPTSIDDYDEWSAARRSWARMNGWPLGALELIREDRRVRNHLLGWPEPQWLDGRRRVRTSPTPDYPPPDREGR